MSLVNNYVETETWGSVFIILVVFFLIWVNRSKQTGLRFFICWFVYFPNRTRETEAHFIPPYILLLTVKIPRPQYIHVTRVHPTNPDALQTMVKNNGFIRIELKPLSKQQQIHILFKFATIIISDGMWKG